MPPLPSPIDEAKRIVEAARTGNVTLRLFGGLSFYFRCPSVRHQALQRNYVDVDFMGHAKQAGPIQRLFKDLGYVPRERFNLLQGNKRLIFNDIQNQRRVDIFLDVFEMSHKFNFKDRIEIDAETISLSDMLATKLQIFEINDKDMKDIISLLTDYDVGDKDQGVVNGSYISKLCSDDWGIYKTFMQNLDKVQASLAGRELDQAHRELVTSRIGRLRNLIENAPKSMKWKMRARVGERVQWYELPEADAEVVDSRVGGETKQPN